MTIGYGRVLVLNSLFLGLLAGSPSLSRAADDAASTAAPQLAVLQTLPVGGSGKWDYLYADSAARRLYVPRSTHTQILDLDTGAVLGDLADTRGVHGVALAPEQSLGFTSNGGANTTSVFDLKSFNVCKTINVGKKPDPITYDPASKHIFCINHGGGTVSVIDPAALDKDPTVIPVGGTLETAVADGTGHVFVNVEDKAETVEIDSLANRVLAHWALAPEATPAGLAIDTAHHRLFVGCGNKKLYVLDSQSGKVLAAVDVGKGVDGDVYDATLGVAMVANGKDGTLSVVKETSPGNFEAVQTIKTFTGAKTIALDTEKHRAVLPCNVPDGKGGQTFGIVVIGLK
ncbi:MAG: YncE family protein [Thermoguttaceae bacterium]